jgi:hypothetical protein
LIFLVLRTAFYPRLRKRKRQNSPAGLHILRRGIRPSTAVIPAKAGIQYAAAHRSITGVSGILDHPLSRMIQYLDLHPALGITAHDGLASSENSRNQTKYEQRQKAAAGSGQGHEITDLRHAGH